MDVRVLNGQVERFKSMPVEFSLQSLDGQVREKVTAFTVERVTGNLRAVDWSQLSENWRHLQNVPFPQPAGRRTVDMLIGVDYADLHVAYEEVCGKPGEPIARRTPLGWTCIGRLCEPQHAGPVRHSFFCQTCQTDIAASLRRSWEIEDVAEIRTTRQTIEEQRVLKDTESSLKLLENGYQVTVPWKVEVQTLPCNLEMAKKRLLNTERRLLKNKALAEAYQKVLEQHRQRICSLQRVVLVPAPFCCTSIRQDHN
jgi:hypothetical protein